MKSLRTARIALALAVLPALAHAAAPDDQATVTQRAEQDIFGDKTELTIGAGVTYAARYPGGAPFQFVPAPVVSVQRGILFADSLRGAGLQYQSGSKFYLSASVFYDLGRLDRNNAWRPGSSQLAGMGDVPGSTTARTLIAQPLTPWLLVSAETEMALRRPARRNRYRMGVELTAIKTAADNVTVDLDAWWGDARYNNAWFGVTPQQAGRTGLSPSRPGAGLYAQAPGASWEHHLDGHWSSTLQLTATRYAGQAAASPIVTRRTSPAATLALAYTY